MWLPLTSGLDGLGEAGWPEEAPGPLLPGLGAEASGAATWVLSLCPTVPSRPAGLSLHAQCPSRTSSRPSQSSPDVFCPAVSGPLCVREGTRPSHSNRVHSTSPGAWGRVRVGEALLWVLRVNPVFSPSRIPVTPSGHWPSWESSGGTGLRPLTSPPERVPHRKEVGAPQRAEALLSAPRGVPI